jgi:site-specific DNA-cytosine methylase
VSDYWQWQVYDFYDFYVAATRRRTVQQGQHRRWHTRRGVIKGGCRWCLEEAVRGQIPGSEDWPMPRNDEE